MKNANDETRSTYMAIRVWPNKNVKQRIGVNICLCRESRKNHTHTHASLSRWRRSNFSSLLFLFFFQLHLRSIVMFTYARDTLYISWILSFQFCSSALAWHLIFLSFFISYIPLSSPLFKALYMRGPFVWLWWHCVRHNLALAENFD